jgi:hypothetical protein
MVYGAGFNDPFSAKFFNEGVDWEISLREVVVIHIVFTVL